MIFGIILFVVLLYVLYRVFVALTAMPRAPTIEEPLEFEDDDDVDDEPEPEPVRVEPIYGALDPALLPPLVEPIVYSNPRIDVFAPVAEQQPWLKPIEVVPTPTPEVVVESSTNATDELYPDSATKED